jgi:hypothetical protein
MGRTRGPSIRRYDRLSFTRFPALGIEDRIPEGTTLWLFRDKVAKPVRSRSCLSRHLEAKGYIAHVGWRSP